MRYGTCFFQSPKSPGRPACCTHKHPPACLLTCHGAALGDEGALQRHHLEPSLAAASPSSSSVTSSPASSVAAAKRQAPRLVLTVADDRVAVGVGKCVCVCMCEGGGA